MNAVLDDDRLAHVLEIGQGHRLLRPDQFHRVRFPAHRQVTANKSINKIFFFLIINHHLHSLGQHHATILRACDPLQRDVVLQQLRTRATRIGHTVQRHLVRQIPNLQVRSVRNKDQAHVGVTVATRNVTAKEKDHKWSQSSNRNHIKPNKVFL